MLYPSRVRQLTQDHPEAIAAMTCAVFLLLGWLALHWQWVGLALLVLPVAYVVGGYESAREGLTTLLDEKELDVDLLMIVAALGAAGLGLWRQEYYLIIDGAVLILIFAISGALESYAMQHTERSIRSLMSLMPDTARVVRSHGEETVAIAQLRVGDEILVKPGELIPTDGLILEGYSTLNEATITGESIPVDKTTGDEVFGGTLNGNGALTLRIHHPPESSLLQQVIRLVEQAQTEKPPSQQFIERFERSYAKVIVLAGILLALLPPLLWNWSWETTIYRALIFLVVASPCALMAAIMPTLLSGIANGARQGILFKNGAQLEQIGRVRAIAFDKTGTLTTGTPQVCTILPTPNHTVAEVLHLAAALESHSEHPIAQAIVVAARSGGRVEGKAEGRGQRAEGEAEGRGQRADFGVSAQSNEGGGQTVIPICSSTHPPIHPSTHPHPTPHTLNPTPPYLSTPQNIQAHPGQGIAGELAQEPIVVGQLNFVQSFVAKIDPELRSHAMTLQAEGKTVIWVARSYRMVGLIAVADQIRPEAQRAIVQLKKLGIEHLIMLTGDHPKTAEGVAQAVGISEVYAELLPDDKLHRIRQLQRRYGAVAMVGDGINDAPALAQATVGIAMGVAGSDVALETADIVLMSDRLEKIATAVELGRRSQIIVKQNIAFALGFIVLLLVATFAGSMTLPLGVIGHEGSTVLVTLSGLRLLRH